MAAAAILEEYDLDIVDFVTDPRTGLPSRCKFAPEPKEVRDACDAIMKDRADRMAREVNIRRQFKERAEFDAEQADRGAVGQVGRRLEFSRATSERMILSEYAKRGEEPVYAAGGVLISPALAEYCRKHAADMAQHVAARSREPKA